MQETAEPTWERAEKGGPAMRAWWPARGTVGTRREEQGSWGGGFWVKGK